MENQKVEDDGVIPLKKSTDPAVSIDLFQRKSSTIGEMLTTVDKLKARLPRVIQLFLLYFALGLLAAVGGCIFKFVEYDKEDSELDERLEYWTNLKTNGNFTEAQIQNDVREWADNYAQIFHEANKWEFRYSVFFAATTFTTCGFGLQAPNTVWGRLFVILYGLPAIMIYGVIAKKVGMLCMHFIKQFCTRFCVSVETYKLNRLKFIGFFFLFGFLAMSLLIYYTATDEGFGHGIKGAEGGPAGEIFASVYFLYQTTLTIGYGDVMMSGANPILTVLIGLWLASTLGLAICFAQEVSESLGGHNMGDSNSVIRFSSNMASRSHCQPPISKKLKPVLEKETK